MLDLAATTRIGIRLLSFKILIRIRRCCEANKFEKWLKNLYTHITKQTASRSPQE